MDSLNIRQEITSADLYEVNPGASNTLKKLRNVGYSLESAIADIIDNSISAGAENVWIASSKCQYLMISDDGDGLTEQEVKNALDIGYINSDDVRRKDDLGRFGIGLKLASFSQCRKLILASKTVNGELSAWSWDLDYVESENRWAILRINIPEYPKIYEKLTTLKHGTVVYWEKLDIHAKGYPEVTDVDKKNFSAKLVEVRKYLGMIFHVFLSKGKIRIIFTDKQEIKPWDPFLLSTGSLRIPLDLSNVPGLKLQPYILPHRKKLSEPEYENAKGPFRSWNEAQGFYVYRGDRLIVYGNWLGLEKYSQPRNTNLARIRLDITNTNDSIWSLDVMKTGMKLPDSGPYRDVIEYAARKTCDEARKIYSRKGVSYRKNKNPEYKSVWNLGKKTDGTICLSLNREYPLIKNYLESINDADEKKRVSGFFRLIEETVPVQDLIALISALEQKTQEIIPDPFETDKTQMKYLIELESLRMKNMTLEEKERELMKTEPFSNYPELIKEHLKLEVKI